MTRLLNLLRQLGFELLALLWPSVCLACGAPDRDLCDDCRSMLREQAEARAVEFAERHLDDEQGDGTFVVGAYEGALRELLVALKHGGRIGFARVLGEQLAVPLRAALVYANEAGWPENRSPPVVVTVASRQSRVRERGYRHVDLIVRRALRVLRSHHQFDAVLITGALRATRGRTGQVGLNAADRERNAARIKVPAHKWRHMNGRQVILVDDVITTGATMRGAVSALEAAGGQVLAVVAVCATMRKDSTGARGHGKDTRAPGA